MLVIVQDDLDIDMCAIIQTALSLANFVPGMGDDIVNGCSLAHKETRMEGGRLYIFVLHFVVVAVRFSILFNF